MATITSPVLKIDKLPGKKVRAVVSCQANFSQAELDSMKQGIKFVAACHLLGDDPEITNLLTKVLKIPTPLGSISIPLPHGDKVEYTYNNPVIFPDRTPTGTEAISFSAKMPSNTLNEDDLPFISLEDEIYALVSLKNMTTEAISQRRSNTVTGRF